MTSIPAGTMLNCGSGQRPFEQQHGWINLDIQERWNPDIIADWNDLHMFADDSMDIVVNHHGIEHVNCSEADAFIRETYRILKPGGSLLIFVPNLRTLAERWLNRQIDDYIYIVNLMGASMGDSHDMHRLHYTPESLRDTLLKNGAWTKIVPFNWRNIPGANLAKDFWIMATEAVK